MESDCLFAAHSWKIWDGLYDVADARLKHSEFLAFLTPSYLPGHATVALDTVRRSASCASG